MSVEFGEASAEGRDTAGVTQATGPITLDYLYQNYAWYLYDYCEGLLGHPAAAADVVQDTFITAGAHIAELQDAELLRRWLYSFARRQCLRALPRRRQTTTLDEFFTEQAEPADADTAEIDVADIEAEGRERETRLLVTTALDRLSDRDREVLNLVIRHGIDGIELAATLGIPPGRVQEVRAAASRRFEEAAADVVVQHGGWGWAGCSALTAIIAASDPAPPVPPRLRRQLARHIGSCAQCAECRGDRVFGPAMLGALPLEMPPASLQQRISAAIFDPGPLSYAYPDGPEDPVDGRDDSSFGAEPKGRRGVRALAAAAAVLLVLAAAGAAGYEFTSGSTGRPRATATGTARRPAPASSAPSPAPSASVATRAAGRRARIPAGRPRGGSPSPAGAALPGPQPTGTGDSPAPKPAPTSHHSKSASPSPTSHSSSPTPPPTSPSPYPSPTSPSPTSPSPSPTS
jgi:RNA polymerase sigma factor (sigma-70 family)